MKECGGGKSPHSDAEFSRRHLQHEPQRKEGKSRDVCVCVYVCVDICECVYVYLEEEGKKERRTEREREGKLRVSWKASRHWMETGGILQLSARGQIPGFLSLLFFDVCVCFFFFCCLLFSECRAFCRSS